MDQPHSPRSPQILVAPLDWGLGHATRCIPVIEELLHQNARVLLGGSGAVRSLLSTEFPALPFVELPEYDISYSRSRWGLPFAMASQIPKILSAIQYENERICDIVKTHEVDGIISDNRYGLYAEGVPSVFMTHQLRIRTGLGAMADDALQNLNYSHITRFSACWVPDAEGSDGLAGALSHPAEPPSMPVTYLGPLSRFSANSTVEGKYLLVLLSGPEPQRTLFEELVMEQLGRYTGSVVLVRGLPGDPRPLEAPPHIQVFDHLPAAALQALIGEASFVVARSGYSTVMDLAFMGKKSILVPTPGQTEQEYLAKTLMEKGFAFSVEQSKFRLKPVLDLAQDFNFNNWPTHQKGALQKAVADLLQQIRSAKDELPK